MEKSRLKALYQDKLVKQLIKQLKIPNRMMAPKINKIVINMSNKSAVGNKKNADQLCEQLTLITGQKAVLTYAKKSIAAFKLREGMPIGAKVTLRNDVMYNFLDKLINYMFPRIRDFRGFSEKAFDQQGNYTFGIAEQIIFPEIDFDKFSQILGMNVTIVFSSKNPKYNLELLKLLEFPFKKRTKDN